MVNEPSRTDLAGVGAIGFRLYASSNPPHWGEEQISAAERSLRGRMLDGGIPMAEGVDHAPPVFSIGAYVRHTNEMCIYNLRSVLSERVTLQRGSGDRRVVFADTWHGMFALGHASGKQPKACWDLVVRHAEDLTDHFIERWNAGLSGAP